MPFFSLAICAGLVAAAIALARPPQLPRAWALLAVAAAPQVLSLYEVQAPSLLLVSAAALAAWCWRNRSLPGMPALAAGIGMNVVVMALHGGRMPIDSATLASIGESAALGTALAGSKNVVVDGSPLGLLADWIVLSVGSRVIVASPGDLLIGLGMLWWLVGHQPTKELRYAGPDDRPARSHAVRSQ